jgi:glycopeptide antibiotics resistance protein
MGEPLINSDKLTNSLLVIYLTVLGWIILLKLGVQFSYMEERKINMVPFAHGYYRMMETIMNVAIFIPLGMYAGVLLRSKFFGFKLLFFFLTSLILEGLQYIFKFGTFDVTDLLTNTTGGIVGYLLYLAFSLLFTTRLKAQKSFNLIFGVGTILIIALLVLLKLNMLPIRYQ